jgi:hypothetical protein
VRFTFDIPPALASVNPRHHAEGPARRRYQQTLDEMRLSVLDRMHRMKWRQLTTPAIALLDMHVADRRGCDVDATIKCSLDCLKPTHAEQPGALIDDRQVELLIARRIVGDGSPRIELGCVDSSELRWLWGVVNVAWEDVG